MEIDLEAHRQAARLAKKRQRKFLDRLKKRPPKDLDQVVMALDGEVFEELDCLGCANCCKTISPTFSQRDVERLGSRLGMRPGNFVEKYLRTDEDGDMVLHSSPCPFLAADNRCQVYEDRPKACRGYPHTGERKFHLQIEITKKNTMVCPAAFKIVERLEEHFKH